MPYFPCLHELFQQAASNLFLSHIVTMILSGAPPVERLLCVFLTLGTSRVRLVGCYTGAAVGVVVGVDEGALVVIPG